MNFLENLELYWYYKRKRKDKMGNVILEPATFFKIYYNQKSEIVTDKRILIAFGKFERFLDEIRTLEDSKFKNSITYQITNKFLK
jgi:hypothetical protein